MWVGGRSRREVSEEVVAASICAPSDKAVQIVGFHNSGERLWYSMCPGFVFKFDTFDLHGSQSYPASLHEDSVLALFVDGS